MDTQYTLVVVVVKKPKQLVLSLRNKLFHLFFTLDEQVFGPQFRGISPFLMTELKSLPMENIPEITTTTRQELKVLCDEVNVTQFLPSDALSLDWVNLMGREADAYPVLNPEQEKALLIMGSEGDKAAQNVIFLCHLRWAYKLTLFHYKYQNSKGFFVPFEELLQAVFFAVYNAVLNFDIAKADWSHGSPFKSYAKPVCKTTILRYLNGNLREINRPPFHRKVQRLLREGVSSTMEIVCQVTLETLNEEFTDAQRSNLIDFISSYYHFVSYIGDVTRDEINQAYRRGDTVNLKSKVEILLHRDRLNDSQVEIISRYFYLRGTVTEEFGFERSNSLFAAIRNYLDWTVHALEVGDEEGVWEDEAGAYSQTQNGMIDIMDYGFARSVANQVHPYGFSILYYHVCEGRTFQEMDDEGLFPGVKRSTIFNIYKRVLDKVQESFKEV